MHFAQQYNIPREATNMENENFPSYYTLLFNSITDAIEALDRQNTVLARDILVRSQETAENAYIEAEG